MCSGPQETAVSSVYFQSAKVYVEIGKAGVPCSAEDLFRLCRGVDPSQKRQFPVVQGLHADGEPVHAAFPVGPQLLQIRRPGIDFHAALRIRQKGKTPAHGFHHPVQLGGAHKGRRAAADKEGNDLRFRRLPSALLPAQRDLGTQRIDIILSGFFPRGGGQKIAVPAFPHTKREMQVQ